MMFLHTGKCLLKLDLNNYVFLNKESLISLLPCRQEFPWTMIFAGEIVICREIFRIKNEHTRDGFS